jgi:2-keto-4-pentenoate hydratase/2-oxohepta-3-ene-1,7-dioic acid hydratase in catechol pathway
MRLYVFDDYRIGALAPDGTLADITDLAGGAVAGRDRMTALITRWAHVRERAAASVAEPAEHAGRADRLPLASVRIRPPQPRPPKIIAAPVNYRRHQAEMGGPGGVYPGETIKTIETYAGFIKAQTSIVGPDSQIRLPLAGRRVDHEAELGVVIGRTASGVSRSAALDHVFGYVPLLDITLRGEEDRSYRKSFDTFTPIGPAIVTADEITDPGALDLRLEVNGEIRQQASTQDLIYDVPRLIEFYSAAITLEPGDLIATGTPAGVGPIEPGDELSLDIGGVGRLEMTVAFP